MCGGNSSRWDQGNGRMFTRCMQDRRRSDASSMQCNRPSRRYRHRSGNSGSSVDRGPFEELAMLVASMRNLPLSTSVCVSAACLNPARSCPV